MTHRFGFSGRILSVAGLIGFCLAASPARAQQVELLGDFRDWSAYAGNDGTGLVCFALTKPTKVAPTPDGYSQAYLYLTNRPGENVRAEVNLVAGFTFAPDTPATLTVAGTAFSLFTQNDAAWLKDPAQAQSLAGIIRAGSTLVVEATSDKGIKIQETFSLAGATAASNAIDSKCAG